MLREAAARQPDDLSLQALLARWFVEQGDAVDAAAHLRAEMAEDNPAILLTIAEIQLRGGHEDEAATLVQRCIAAAPELVADVSALGCEHQA